MAARRTGGGRVDGGETGASDIGSEPRPPKPPVDPLDSRRKKLLSRVAELKSGKQVTFCKSSTFGSAERSGCAQSTQIRDRGSNRSFARPDRECNEVFRQHAEKTGGARAVDKEAPRWAGAAILLALNRGAPRADKKRELSKVLISNADSKLLAEIESADAIRRRFRTLISSVHRPRRLLSQL